VSVKKHPRHFDFGNTPEHEISSSQGSRDILFAESAETPCQEYEHVEALEPMECSSMARKAPSPQPSIDPPVGSESQMDVFNVSSSDATAEVTSPLTISSSALPSSTSPPDLLNGVGGSRNDLSEGGNKSNVSSSTSASVAPVLDESEISQSTNP